MSDWGNFEIFVRLIDDLQILGNLQRAWFFELKAPLHHSYFSCASLFVEAFRVPSHWSVAIR